MLGRSNIKRKEIKYMLQSTNFPCVCANKQTNIITIIIIIAAASIRRAEDYQTARCHIAAAII